MTTALLEYRRIHGHKSIDYVLGYQACAKCHLGLPYIKPETMDGMAGWFDCERRIKGKRAAA